MDQGHEQSFLSFVEKHKGILYKVINAYAKSQEDKRDLFQEIMTNLWKAYPSFKGDAKISTWMYRVALYTSITRFRDERKQIKYEKIQHDAPQSGFDPFVDDSEEPVKFLYEAISKLTSVDKAIILMLLDEKSYKEIAQIIGLRPTAVGMRINRAKDKLMNLLKTIKP
jgi:RNA polymerase sigma-70 factor, ECF subfamily